jgi:hypothetical protein
LALLAAEALGGNDHLLGGPGKDSQTHQLGLRRAI